MSTPVPPPDPQQPDPGQQPYAAPQPGASYPPAGSSYGAPAPGGYPTAPMAGQPYPGAMPAGMPAPAEPSRRGLSITGLILAAIPCTGLIGLIISIVALVKTRGGSDSAARTMAIIGIIAGAIWTLLAIVFWVMVGNTVAVCMEHGNGVHYINGVTYTCNY